MKKRWNKLQPCEKKVAVIAAGLAVVCFATSVILDMHDKKNGGAK